jgi:uncharacterized short protein YbdD (DUF466 family)
MERARRIARQIGWYCGALMGDTHYQRYLEHCSRTHHGEPVLTESEYWRKRYRADDVNPGPRCC